MTPQELALPDSSIEINLARLSVLISRYQASLCQGQENTGTKESFFHTLEAWASKLPENLRYSASSNDPNSLQEIEAASVSDALSLGSGQESELTTSALP